MNSLIRHHKQHGFTLVEAMIALVIFSIGLLGLAGLQASGMRSNTTSLFRTQAIIQANDMAERIRANREAASAGAYDSITTTLPSSPPDCINNQCTAAQLATFDAFEWNTFNSELLPSGRGTVQRHGTSNLYTITVMWDEDRTGVAGEGCSGNSAADLKCYSTTFELRQ